MLHFTRIFLNHTTYESEMDSSGKGKYLSYCEDSAHCHYDVKRIYHDISSNISWGLHEGVSIFIITSSRSYTIEEGKPLTIFSLNLKSTLDNQFDIMVTDQHSNTLCSITGINGKTPTTYTTPGYSIRTYTKSELSHGILVDNLYCELIIDSVDTDITITKMTSR